MLISMIWQDQNLVPGLLQVLNGLNPGGAFAVLAAVAVLTYVTLAPDRQMLPVRPG
jgi:hypothetical protein